MRDPGIHIKKSDLVKILKDILPPEIKCVDFANLLLKKARPFSVDIRVVNITSERIEKKVTKMLTSTTRDADLMARIMYATRIRLKHRGVQQIKPSSREWNMVKELANLATNFCIDFSLSKREGFARYIELGSGKMKSFNLSRLINMHEAISRTHEALVEIANDPTPKLSEDIHQYYRVTVAKRTGIINNFKDEPDKYVYFVRVASLVTSLTVKYTYFIDAQFSALEYRNSYPEPPQLIGQKAKERLNKWLFEKGIRV